MSRGGRPVRRKRGGILASSKSRVSGPTPWWQWVIGIPLLAVMLAALGLFVWVTFIRPDLAVNVRTAQATVVARGETPAAPPSARHHVTVLVKGEEVLLFGPKETIEGLADGETLVVRYTESAARGITVLGWSRPDPAAAGTPGP